MADLKTNLLGFVMNSPVIGASGTVGYGVEYEELADFAKIGGISGKGLTLHGQYGNKGERLWETPSGLINSIGLQNPGVQHFIDVELPEMLELKQKYGTVAIANLGGHSEEEYVEGAAMLSESAVDIVELNISCPNVKVGGMAYGVKAEAAGEVVRMVRAACKKPLMVKLSPQAENIPEMCKAVEAAGADAISLTNTFQACAIDLEKRRPVFNNIFAGLAGQLVGVHDAAHGRADDDVHIHLLDLISHSLHHLGAAVRVLLQISHLAVCAGVPAGGQQEVTLQKCVTALQNFKCFTHCTSPSLFSGVYSFGWYCTTLLHYLQIYALSFILCA